MFQLIYFFVFQTKVKNEKQTSNLNDLVLEATQVTTRDNPRQHKTTRNITSTTQANTITTRDNTSATRDNTSTTRVGSNLKIVLIYSYHRCMLEPGILGSKALFML